MKLSVCMVSMSVLSAAAVSNGQQAGDASVCPRDGGLTPRALAPYRQGLAALQASRWSAARAWLARAWGVHHHEDVAPYLGFSELKLRRYSDAAEHLSWYLRHAPACRAEGRQWARSALAIALANTATLTVRVLPAGAEVAVDGAVLGASPLSAPVFLAPGAHSVTARKDGYRRQRVAVQAEEGRSETLTIRLVAVTRR